VTLPIPETGVVIRAPNHLGDVVMALGALRDRGGDIVVVESLVPLLRMAGLPGRIFPFRRTAAGWGELVERLRAARHRRGILMSGSLSAALLFRLAGIRELRGMDQDHRGWLLSDRIPPERLRGRHRVNNLRMVADLPPLDPLRPHPLAPPSEEVARWRAELAADGVPVVGLFPGSNAPARRWEPGRFREVGLALARRGVRVVALGGPGERALTAAAVEGVPGARDLGGATGLEGLAAILSLCTLFVTNDTGPMHLAAAVGTPTLTLWASSDPSEVHPLGARDERVHGVSLPCAPCKKNHCPRSGGGTILPEARTECMRLIEPRAVVDAALGILG